MWSCNLQVGWWTREVIFLLSQEVSFQLRNIDEVQSGGKGQVFQGEAVCGKAQGWEKASWRALCQSAEHFPCFVSSSFVQQPSQVGTI